MTRVLTQTEIDALIGAANSAQNGAIGDQATAGNSLSYDFRHPNRLSKDQLRSLESLHDNFSSQFGASLSGFTRTVIDADVVSVNQITYLEFISSLAAPSCTYTFTMPPLEGMGLIDFNPGLVFSFVDRIFGGKGNAKSSQRELTPIEKTLLGKIVDKAFQALGKSWEHIAKIGFKPSGLETNPQFVQVIPPEETVIVVSFQLKMEDASGTLSVCYPYLALEKVIDKLSAQGRNDKPHRDSVKNQSSENAKLLMPVNSEVGVTLGGAVVKVRELLDVKVGDIIRLDTLEKDEVSVFVGTKIKFMGHAGRVGNKKAVRITKVLQ